jgi:hypothetical protein
MFLQTNHNYNCISSVRKCSGCGYSASVVARAIGDARREYQLDARASDGSHDTHQRCRDEAAIPPIDVRVEAAAATCLPAAVVTSRVVCGGTQYSQRLDLGQV